MENNEIYIDGVNVKKCDFFHPEYGRDCHIALAFDYHNDKGTYYGCDQNPNCYYKQLQRLKQENEKQRKALEEIREYINTLSSVDSDFVNTETYLRITDKVNEVLNESKQNQYFNKHLCKQTQNVFIQ